MIGPFGRQRNAKNMWSLSLSFFGRSLSSCDHLLSTTLYQDPHLLSKLFRVAQKNDHVKHDQNVLDPNKKCFETVEIFSLLFSFVANYRRVLLFLKGQKTQSLPIS